MPNKCTSITRQQLYYILSVLNFVSCIRALALYVAVVTIIKNIIFKTTIAAVVALHVTLTVCRTACRHGPVPDASGESPVAGSGQNGHGQTMNLGA